jgi:hypothetical protein
LASSPKVGDGTSPLGRCRGGQSKTSTRGNWRRACFAATRSRSASRSSCSTCFAVRVIPISDALECERISCVYDGSRAVMARDRCNRAVQNANAHPNASANRLKSSFPGDRSFVCSPHQRQAMPDTRTLLPQLGQTRMTAIFSSLHHPGQGSSNGGRANRLNYLAAKQFLKKPNLPLGTAQARAIIPRAAKG